MPLGIADKMRAKLCLCVISRRDKKTCREVEVSHISKHSPGIKRDECTVLQGVQVGGSIDPGAAKETVNNNNNNNNNNNK
jgi:hypothetical protein